MMRQAASTGAILLLLVVATIQGFVVPAPRHQQPQSRCLSGTKAVGRSWTRPVGRRMQQHQLWADVADKATEGGEVTERVITVADAAITHLKELKSKQGVDHLWLRMGVRSGGCSGMSYVLDVMKPEEITAEDHVEKYSEHGFSCVVDPQSMLYLFGLQLDYKDALIGGGFQFMNPNSNETCGCGKSFGV